MIVALDFDETYNKAPGLFDIIVKNFQGDGHIVILATYRHPVEDYDPLFERLKNNKVLVICTDGKGKKKFLEDMGIKVDIWIDDNPRSILEDSAWKPDSPELHKWREENIQKRYDDAQKQYDKALKDNNQIIPPFVYGTWKVEK